MDHRVLLRVDGQVEGQWKAKSIDFPAGTVIYASEEIFPIGRRFWRE